MDKNSLGFFRKVLVERRVKLIKLHKIDLVLDVGASTGQYALELRKSGYEGKIVSFEPLLASFQVLKKNAMKDSLWQVENFALGNKNGKVKINVSKNSVSISILDMMPMVTSVAPEARYDGREEINITKLDKIFHHYYEPGSSVFLKIDCQGFEKEILKGAARSLKNIVGLQLETSLVTLYKGETLLHDMIRFIRKFGYTLMSIEPGFNNPETGQLLQADVVFFKDIIK